MHSDPPGGETPAQAAGDIKARARVREAVISKTFDRLVRPWPQEDREQCTLNRQLLRVVSESYFKDLERKKQFHGITTADFHKCAGYMAKWIMRFRPVQLTSEAAGTRALLANEYLALAMAFKFLKIDVTKLPPELYKTMVYALRFRHIDGNAWAMTFYLLEQKYSPPVPGNGHH